MRNLFSEDWFKSLQKTGLGSIFFLLICLSACEKFPEMEYMLVLTESAEQINDSTAMFSAFIDNRSDHKIIESGFYWGVVPNEKELKLVIDNEISGVLTLETDQALIQGRSIFVRAFAKTNTFEVVGKELMLNVKGEINKGTLKQLQSRTLGGGWCHRINLGFAANRGHYFVLENGDVLFYDFLSNKSNFVQNSQELKEMDVGFNIEGQEYFFSKNRFYRLNVDDFSLIPLNPWQTQDRSNVSGFVIDQEIYIGLGRSDSNSSENLNSFWKYNINSDSWLQVGNFPGKSRDYAVGFTANGFGGITGGYGLHRINDIRSFAYFSDFWQYDPMLNLWQEKRGISELPRGFYSYAAASHQEVVYTFINTTLYRYYPAFNFWEGLVTTDEICVPYLFSYQDNLYLAGVNFDSNENVLTLFQYEK